jgi:hypothetical protein
MKRLTTRFENMFCLAIDSGLEQVILLIGTVLGIIKTIETNYKLLVLFVNIASGG